MLIALTSVKGSPGVTTFAVALAAHWPGPARRLLAECDPAGGDLALRFGLASAPGLVSLAAAARRTHDPAVVWDHAQSLSRDVGVIAAPPGGVQARAALHALVTSDGGPLLDQAARDPETVVFVDCGRMDPGSPAEVLARRSDVLIVVSGTHGDDLVHLAVRLGELGRWSACPSLLLAGQGYPTPDVERELGIPALGRIPHDPVSAAVLTGHAPPPRRHGSGGLAPAAVAIARALATTPAPGRGGPPKTASPASGSAAGAVSRVGVGAGQIVPGVPAQQVRMPGLAVPPPPTADLHPASVQVSDSRRNGHRPAATPGKDVRP